MWYFFFLSLGLVIGGRLLGVGLLRGGGGRWRVFLGLDVYGGGGR